MQTLRIYLLRLVRLVCWSGRKPFRPKEHSKRHTLFQTPTLKRMDMTLYCDKWTSYTNLNNQTKLMRLYRLNDPIFCRIHILWAMFKRSCKTATWFANTRKVLSWDTIVRKSSVIYARRLLSRLIPCFMFLFTLTWRQHCSILPPWGCHPFDFLDAFLGFL